jgi:small subunit ribosomal protein S6
MKTEDGQSKRIDSFRPSPYLVASRDSCERDLECPEGGFMRLYELTIIISPTLDDTSIQNEIDRIEKQITGAEGQIEKIERWGIRRLTYRISTQNQGYYVHFLFRARPGLSAELERSMRLNENILRFLTVLSPGTAPVPKPVKTSSPAQEDEGQFDDFLTEQG